jgi:prefoldin subunit 5
MEWRVAELESEVRRLRSQLEAIQLSVSRLEERRRSSLDKALWAAALVVTAALYGAMAVGFGWI